MAQTPCDTTHAYQIAAGTSGRNAGHAFEKYLTDKINSLVLPLNINPLTAHLYTDSDPALELVNYIAYAEGLDTVESVQAFSTGDLATSEFAQAGVNIQGRNVSKSKSDIVLVLESRDETITIGVSLKQCNNPNPTNAQLFFTTADGFYSLLYRNNLINSDDALLALRQFCGDVEFRPMDALDVSTRTTDPRRYFWEEIDSNGRRVLEDTFEEYQREITHLLFQAGYDNDPFPPSYLLHKTRRSSSLDRSEFAIYSIEKLIDLSLEYQGFVNKSYSVKKGSYRDPAGVSHLAPRFGIVQMQRGGQKQHPTQLQFNLEAGYFYKI